MACVFRKLYNDRRLSKLTLELVVKTATWDCECDRISYINVETARKAAADILKQNP